MTNKEKQTILEMRKQGIGYGTIAQELGVSKSTISSYCARMNVSKTDFNKMKRCLCCDDLFHQTTKTKEKKFCSKACCQKWWNEHPEKVNRKANYNIMCRECGKSFVSYGFKDRKFCSRKCYIQNRYYAKCDTNE